jgi:rhodanese-related sulfurtransferase
MKWYASGGDIAKIGPFPSEKRARKSLTLISETDEEYATYCRRVQMSNAMAEATHRRLIRAGVEIPAFQPRAQMRGGFPPDLKVWKE